MKSKNSSFWLYVLGIYILLQFLWWAWMLIDLNLQIQAFEVNYHNSESNSNQITPLDNGFINRKIAMIIGEGSVFILLLAFGFFQVKRALQKELENAKRQRNFLLSVTHELNSPIAGIQLNLETALNRKLDEQKQRSLLQNAVEQNSRLQNLVENILTSTRLEENVLQLNLQKVNLSDLTNSIAQKFNSDLASVNCSQIESDVFVQLDTVAFESILKNLIENGIKYSEKPAEITISVHRKVEYTEVKVTDKGIGISKENQPRVFDRFYRVQNEDTRNTKGTGLGLYIAKQLAELMNVELSVQSQLNKGSAFTLKFNSI